MRKGPAKTKTEIENPPRTTRASTRSANDRTNRRRLKVHGVRVFLFAVSSADCTFVVLLPGPWDSDGHHLAFGQLRSRPLAYPAMSGVTRTPTLDLARRVAGSRHLADEEVEQRSFLPLVDNGLPRLVRPPNHLDRRCRVVRHEMDHVPDRNLGEQFVELDQDGGAFDSDFKHLIIRTGCETPNSQRGDLLLEEFPSGRKATRSDRSRARAEGLICATHPSW